MDLIYTDAAGVEQGVLQAAELDLAFGEDENDFELQQAASSHCCVPGALVYLDERIEYGGIVDDLRSITAQDTVICCGRTWHGILNSKIIQPDAGEDYLAVSGDANEALSFLIDRLGLSARFAAASVPSGISISGYRFQRYCKGYDGIRAMLDAHGAKLCFSAQQDGRVQLFAAPAADHSGMLPDALAADIRRSYHPVNHLICLGQGELAARTVLHLYADADGAVSTQQTLFGMDEVCEVYDYPAVESAEELQAAGIRRLKELHRPVAIDVPLDESADLYDVGDILGTYDVVTKTEVSAAVVKKIVSIKDGQITVAYKVGVNHV